MGISNRRILAALAAFATLTTLMLVLSIHVFPDQLQDISNQVMDESLRWMLGEASTDEERQLQRKGYYLLKGNVQFRFINPLKKVGNPEEMKYLNMERFADVCGKEILEPLDFDIESIRPPENIEEYEHAKATIVSLVRNEELEPISEAISNFENLFNAKFQYPYTFMNDVPFTEKFKKAVRALSKAPMEFVTIPEALWEMPSHVDAKKAEKEMQRLADHNIQYAKKISYHNMCRFYSGNFYNVPEMRQYRYYWRLEPGVNYFTDLKYDVFKYLEGTNKVYGFTISLYDNPETVETLWPETLKFLNEGSNFEYVNKKGAFQWLTENQQLPKVTDKANGYSTCHFWSNFEIGDMDFFRSVAYDLWFKHLDRTGKFYYERWGDAPVHSVGLALFADKDSIHWFRDIGYYHFPYYNCPNAENTKGCIAGQFSQGMALQDQNCLQSWIDYSVDDLNKYY